MNRWQLLENILVIAACGVLGVLIAVMIITQGFSQ